MKVTKKTMENIHLIRTKYGSSCNEISSPLEFFLVNSIRLINGLDADMREPLNEKIFSLKMENKLIRRYDQ